MEALHEVSTKAVGLRYAVAATLFVITFALTMLGQYILRRFREEYD